ncbi:uncharacterized protein LOC133467616 [Phyllopteryx taeniolatus]|uniref:uncharacterized protein LOC133467616 n=1 Tax=Phyllopteryx taeniolatus TaxID=161469 RepID=UPI002AD4354F|nr:uncharacterized protein LOC133467616 [Phyllopteryx taeniolatus]
MAAGCCALILLCCILIRAESSAPSRGIREAKYSNSFRLARSARNRVQQLLLRYKEQRLGDKNFEDRGGHLKDLPLLSTDFDSWLHLTDWERLHAALSDMQAYRTSLEWKRKELETEEKEKTAHNTLSQSIKHIELDLRDLMSQVKSQMSYIKNASRKPSFPTVRTPMMSKTVWESHVEGYIILRDLDLYLTKLARDFLLLASKTH